MYGIYICICICMEYTYIYTDTHAHIGTFIMLFWYNAVNKR